MYDERDSYATTTWRARFTVYSITEGVTKYFAHAQTVCTRPLLVTRPGNEASQVIYMQPTTSHWGMRGGGGGGGHQK